MADGSEKPPVDDTSGAVTPASKYGRWGTLFGGAIFLGGLAEVLWVTWKWQMAFFALPGIALGVAAVVFLPSPLQWARGRALGGRATYGLTDLVVAIFPLLLFALVVTLFAAGGFPPWQQLLIGFAFAPLIVAIWRLEGDAGRVAAEKATVVIARVAPWFGAAVTGGLFAVAIIALILINVAWGVVDRFIELGGWATLFAAAAVGIWLFAGAVRLAGFATTIPRALALPPLLFPLYQGAALIGVLPGYQTLRHVHYWLDGLIVLGGLTLLAVDGFMPRWSPNRRASWSVLARQIGLIACVAAAVLFAVTVIGGRLSSSSTSEGHYDNFGTYHPGYAATPPAELDDQTLAQTYAPLLNFDNKERYFLEDVQSYLNDAKLVSLRGEQVPPGPLKTDALPKSCTDGGDRCFVLTCKAGEGTCARPMHLPNGNVLGGVEYARVVHRNAATTSIFDVKTPFGDQLTTLVQYWLFYRYDKWESPTIAGWLTQQHEGDWEAVTLGFSTSKPLFVAYSAHCGGRWVPWGKIEAEPLLWVGGHWTARTSASDPSLHPSIAVARGSHANYIRAWHGRATDWGSCGVDISQATTGALSYVWNVRDRTDESIEVYPREIKLVDEHVPPMSFPGYWGLSDRVTLANFRHPSQELGKPGKGPLSPPLQPLWISPLTRIFHGPHWRKGE